MAPRFGIDTSILVRLMTGEPPAEFDTCLRLLQRLVDGQGAELFASNQVIGEAYVAVQHHYRVTKTDARDALLSVLSSGLVAPRNGAGVFEALRSSGGAGLLDRLIADDCLRDGLVPLTLDRRMARGPNVRLLSEAGQGDRTTDGVHQPGSTFALP